MPEEVKKVTSLILNPLIFFEVEFAEGLGKPVTIEDLLRFVTHPTLKSTLEATVERYKALAARKRVLISAPAEDHILDKLVWPLRQALVSYVLGNYLGTIALCGAVGEMLAILLFEIAPVTMRGEQLDEATQIGLFGSKFEKLNQDRRVEILHTFGTIDKQMKAKFDLLRTKRRSYMHFFSSDYSKISDDALEMFYAAEELVAPIIGHQLQDGQFMVNPAIVSYLEAHGAIREFVPGEETTTSPAQSVGNSNDGT